MTPRCPVPNAHCPLPSAHCPLPTAACWMPNAPPPNIAQVLEEEQEKLEAQKLAAAEEAERAYKKAQVTLTLTLALTLT